MLTTPQFLASLTDTEKDTYSRAYYKLLMRQDPAFRHKAKVLHLGKDESDADDRFIFLYLCKRIQEEDEYLKRELSVYIYMLREVSFRLVPSGKHGVSIRPDTSKWNTAGKGAPSNGMEQFKSAWFIISQEYRDWMKKVFEEMPKDFPEISEKNVA